MNVNKILISSLITLCCYSPSNCSSKVETKQLTKEQIHQMIKQVEAKQNQKKNPEKVVISSIKDLQNKLQKLPKNQNELKKMFEHLVNMLNFQHKFVQLNYESALSNQKKHLVQQKLHNKLSTFTKTKTAYSSKDGRDHAELISKNPQDIAMWKNFKTICNQNTIDQEYIDALQKLINENKHKTNAQTKKIINYFEKFVELEKLKFHQNQHINGPVQQSLEKFRALHSKLQNTKCYDCMYWHTFSPMSRIYIANWTKTYPQENSCCKTRINKTIQNYKLYNDMRSKLDNFKKELQQAIKKKPAPTQRAKKRNPKNNLKQGGESLGKKHQKKDGSFESIKNINPEDLNREIDKILNHESTLI